MANDSSGSMKEPLPQTGEKLSSNRLESKILWSVCKSVHHPLLLSVMRRERDDKQLSTDALQNIHCFLMGVFSPV